MTKAITPAASLHDRAIIGIVIALCAAFLILPLSALYYLGRGMDVSDTGHYYTAIRHLADVKMMSTQFALVWKLLPLPDNIYVNRLMLFVLLIGSGAAMFMQAGRSVLAPASSLPLQNWLLASVGGGGAAIYYYYWLPDPSYNSVGLVLMALVLGAVFALVKLVNVQSWQFRGAAMLAGFSGLALSFTRPVSALILLTISALLFLLLAERPWQKLLPLAVFTLLGAALFFALVQVFIEPINITWERLQGGMQKREILGINRLVGKGFAGFSNEVSTALGKAPFGLFLAIIGGALAAPGVAARLTNATHAYWLNLIGGLLGAAGLAYLSFNFWRETEGLGAVGLNHIAALSLNLGLIAVLSAGLAAALQTKPEWRHQFLRLTLVCALLVLVSLSFSAFGTGAWLRKSGIAGVFIVLACALIAVQMAKKGGVVWSLGMAAALLLVMLGVRANMTQSPYRQSTPLAEQTAQTSIRGGRSMIRTDVATKAFFDALNAVADDMGPVGQRPILIDLSGRLPMVQYHMNARPPYTAWLLSAYDGSDAFFAHLVGRMSEEELARAWILDAPGYKYRLDPAPLAARGFDLQDDYRVAAKTMAPYIENEIVLLAPKARPLRAVEAQ